GSREVQDLLALLALAMDRDDAAALATVLRSPLGPLSDDALVVLARSGGRHGLVYRAMFDEQAARLLAPDDALALGRVASLVERLAREADRLGTATLLEAALSETDYLAAIAAGLAGKVRSADGGPKRWGTSGKRIYEVHKERDAAQMRRLLYVACTRARDLLVLASRGGRNGRNGSKPGGAETWRTCLDAALPALDGLLRILPDGIDPAHSPALPDRRATADRQSAIGEALRAGTELPLPASDPALAAAVEEARMAVARVASPGASGRPTIV